jgi:hypothetical protein
MKIAVIAPSGAGKTVYLTGLHGYLTQYLSEDSNYYVDYRLTNSVLNGELGDRFTKLVRQGDFGDPTEKMSQYPWTLSIQRQDNTKATLSIELIDFPGEALYRATYENQDQVDQITKSLSECDGFIVLLDGGALVRAANQTDPAVLRDELKSKAVRDILEIALDRRRTRLRSSLASPNEYAFGSGQTPIAFALTKGDQVESWLTKPLDSKTFLQTIKEFFNANSTYDKRQEDLEALIHSQFAKIIDAPDVISARSIIRVYNEEQKRFDPRNLDHLLQFVIFVGLRNAAAEYEQRNNDWQSDYNQKNTQYQQEYAKYEADVKAKNHWNQQGGFAKAWDSIFSGINAEYHNKKIESSHQSMSGAASRSNSSLQSVKQSEQNYQDAQYFACNIMSNKLIYLLSNPKNRLGFEQKGLPINILSKQEWWKYKLKLGQEEINRVKL